VSDDLRLCKLTTYLNTYFMHRPIQLFAGDINLLLEFKYTHCCIKFDPVASVVLFAQTSSIINANADRPTWMRDK
jgi:hypothetical protein